MNRRNFMAAGAIGAAGLAAAALPLRSEAMAPILPRGIVLKKLRANISQIVNELTRNSSGSHEETEEKVSEYSGQILRKAEKIIYFRRFIEIPRGVLSVVHSLHGEALRPELFIDKFIVYSEDREQAKNTIIRDIGCDGLERKENCPFYEQDRVSINYDGRTPKDVLKRRDKMSVNPRIRDKIRFLREEVDNPQFDTYDIRIRMDETVSQSVVDFYNRQYLQITREILGWDKFWATQNDEVLAASQK